MSDNNKSALFYSKLKAASVHMTLSVAVVAAFLGLVFFYWYPGILSEISGLYFILLVMVAVDLVLGPLLTFVVYKPNKRTLKFDLAVIAAIQLSALLYAMNTVYEGHPLYVTYNVDRFTVVNASEVDPSKAQNLRFFKSRLSSPILAYAKMPEDKEMQEVILFESLAGGKDIDKRPELYEPIENHYDEVFNKSIDITDLLKNADTRSEFEAFIKKHENKDMAFLPLVGNGKVVTWAFDKKNKAPLGYVDVNPWAKTVNK